MCNYKPTAFEQKMQRQNTKRAYLAHFPLILQAFIKII